MDDLKEYLPESPICTQTAREKNGSLHILYGKEMAGVLTDPNNENLPTIKVIMKGDSASKPDRIITEKQFIAIWSCPGL